jgi:hypothetical protein
VFLKKAALAVFAQGTGIMLLSIITKVKEIHVPPQTGAFLLENSPDGFVLNVFGHSGIKV